MTLDEYQNKRYFAKSPEPKGEMRKEINIIDKDEIKDIKDENIRIDTRGPIFVIHEHHAKRLHWDLRLEIGGVLRSWAVPKDPIDVSHGIRRLAIQVEDHPIEYADFEGSIPEGMYGAGTVKIWDKGDLKIEENRIDKLAFKLKGKKMNGIFSLVYVPNMGEKSWLFIKRSK